MPQKRPGEMTFVFHSDLQDTDERVSHDWSLDPRHVMDEIKYNISCSGIKIAEREQFPKFLSLDIFMKNSRNYLNYGDLFEFAADNRKSHWVMYLGNDNPNKVDLCIHFSKRLHTITIKPLASVAKDRPIRRVNGVYSFESKSQDEIKSAVIKIQNAINSNPELLGKMINSFNSSECFAAWLRYHKSEFLKANVAVNKIMCQIKYTDGFVEDMQFNNLSNCVDKIRLLQKEGNRSIIKHRNIKKDLLQW